MKKLITLTAAILISIGASAQKQVQKILFPQATYTTQSQNSKNGLFTQKQTEMINSVPLGGKIYIEDFKVKTLDGKEVQAQALKLETN